MHKPDILIVGGGLAGLCCARHLCEKGISCQILEGADTVGGRVQTDEMDGFLLDHGFQVFLTAYPEAKDILDYDALQMQPFEPGALIRYRGKFHRLVDPWRRPRHLLATALSPTGSLGDKLRIARLRRRLASLSLDRLYQQPETTTLERLRSEGFSDQIIQRFFRPFLGGVFLEPDLATSSRKFEFVFRMFADGQAVLPACGMQAIPRQIAANLPEESIRTNTPVGAVQPGEVTLASGERLRASAVVVATEAPTAAKLLGEPREVHSNHVTCLYFAAEQPPHQEPILFLNGDGHGPVNNLCVPSQIARSYAPDRRALISVTALDEAQPDDQRLVATVREQLNDWFGSETKDWQHLRTYHVRHALPHQTTLNPVQKPVIRSDGIVVCGDYLDMASIQGAMASGRRAAESLVQSR